jgi:hypothetical protein
MEITMIKPTGVSLVVSFHALFLFLPQAALGASAQPGTSPGLTQSQRVNWTSSGVQHVYGLPDAKPKDKGTLTLSAAGLSFAGKASRSMIPRQSVVAVSAGNERVEIWGMKGQVLRAVIPNGGGVAAAMVMHHRVDMLTVEFADDHGGYHGAVFFLPAKEATRALESFSTMPIVPRELKSNVCQDGFVHPHSLLLAAPVWQQAEVPAAYRALVYEQLFDRLRQVQGVDRVYRDGEANANQGCPEYTMQLSINGFKEGSQVKRAVMGPAGFFVSTTQMKFDATVTDATGRVAMQEQIKATTRGETESTNVAKNVAGKLAKSYSGVVKKANESELAASRGMAPKR